MWDLDSNLPTQNPTAFTVFCPLDNGRHGGRDCRIPAPGKKLKTPKNSVPGIQIIAVTPGLNYWLCYFFSLCTNKIKADSLPFPTFLPKTKLLNSRKEAISSHWYWQFLSLSKEALKKTSPKEVIIGSCFRSKRRRWHLSRLRSRWGDGGFHQCWDAWQLQVSHGCRASDVWKLVTRHWGWGRGHLWWGLWSSWGMASRWMSRRRGPRSTPVMGSILRGRLGVLWNEECVWWGAAAWCRKWEDPDSDRRRCSPVDWEDDSGSDMIRERYWSLLRSHFITIAPTKWQAGTISTPPIPHLLHLSLNMEISLPSPEGREGGGLWMEDRRGLSGRWWGERPSEEGPFLFFTTLPRTRAVQKKDVLIWNKLELRGGEKPQQYSTIVLKKKKKFPGGCSFTQLRTTTFCPFQGECPSPLCPWLTPN